MPDLADEAIATMPKFQNMDVWRQAEVLMQPAFIRLVANIGKQLDESAWKGRYEDVLVWDESIDDATKARVMLLRQELEALAAEADTVESHKTEVEQALAALPTPYPGYQLCLSQGDRQVCVDLWELCYKICFRDYDADSGTSRPKGFRQSASQGVEIDTTLFDETGDVDWDRLDAKTRLLVNQIFANLPG